MILVVSNMYPSEKYPNYGVFVKNFYEQLSSSEKADIIYLKKTPNMVVKIINYIVFYIKIFKNYTFGKYDLIYVHYAGYNAPPILFGNLFNKRTKLIVNVHGSDVTPEKKLEEKTNFFTKYLIDIADLVVVPSKYFEEVVIEKYGKSVPIWISPSAGIDFNIFNDRKNKRKNEFFTIGYVSRIDKEKGWDTLLYALQQLVHRNHDLKLIMVGDGAQNKEALDLIKKLNLEEYVEKYNCLTQIELVEIYSKIDVFIFPSTRAGESLGLVGLESMACGTPVIGSKLGGIQTYLEDGKNGYFVRPGNQKDIEEKIEKYRKLSDKEKNRLSQYAIETAKKYDSKIVNQRLIKKISEISIER
ncbi:glycosyltransferase family 4 protein [Enterococcus sp. C76]|uniref:glycosyltransferase family 4 protein n=1 Tax=Enterococcus sp. C76 TaxID=3231334 RepID=UPI0034A0170F